MEDYLTVAEAAAQSGIPARTIHYRLRRGLVTGRLYGRIWLVSKAEVAQWAGQFRRGRKPRERAQPRARGEE